MPEKKKTDQPSWIRYSSLGIECVAAIAFFAAIGYWVDRKWDSQPWGLVIGSMLGLIGGMYNLVRASLAAFKPPVPPDRRHDNGPPQPP